MASSDSVASPRSDTDRLHSQVTRLTALVEASKILNSTLDLDRLLELILEVATRELDADRGTVYLLDRKAGELRARISQQLASRVLRVQVGQGIAGKVAETGETIRIEDAYGDSRFLQKFDTAYGYRTRSVLCMPIRNKTGEIIGVIQLLNKIHGTFGVEDEAFLQSLTVHVAIALENAQLHAKIVDQQRIRTELELARQIQQNLLPRPPERWHRYRIAALAETCFEVGGDFYDFLTVSPTTMAAVIADVSGKGVSSALVMSTMQATLRAMLVGVHSFERLLVKMNEVIHDYTNGRMFVTLFLALLDTESSKLHYINAGHNPPILIHKDGRCEQLEEGGTVLGLLPNVSYTRAQTDLLAGDVLLLYTDGLMEATNAADEMFGVEGLVDSVRALPDGSPQAIIHSIVSRIRDFTGGAPQSDDQTLVVISPDS